MAAGVKCGQLDITKISEDDLLVNQDKGSIWVRSDVDEKIYVIPNDNNPYVVIKFNDGCFVHLCNNPDLTDVNRSILFWGAALKTPITTAPDADPAGGGDGTIGNPSSSSEEEADEQVTTICGVDPVKLRQAQARLDSASINEKGFQPAAVVPAEAIIPMKSNIFTYGPYASSNFTTSLGGTQVDTNTDLCPWVFGSTDLMNMAAQELVNKTVIGLVKAETGSATITGLPNIPTLGSALASGPSLTGINTTFGSSGITTSYEFRTYTPKLGGLSRAYIDRIKRIAKNRQDNIKFLRAFNINQIKINRKIRVAANNNIKQANGELAKPKTEKNSLARIIMGEMNDLGQLSQGSGQRTVVGIETLSKSVLEMRYDYKQKAFMSLDGLFGPVSIDGGYQNSLPQYIQPNSGYPHWSSPLHAQPPFATGVCPNPSTPNFHENYNIRVNNLYLNPLANPNSIPHYDPEDPSGSPGHCIDLVGREDEVPVSGLLTNLRLNGDPLKYSDDYRFLGMRGPIVLHSWGYDVDGKPIPNFIDSEADTKQGIFKTSKDTQNGLKDQFMTDWIQKPGTWPVGPVDLRFDRERGVWVSPQPFKIVVARVIKQVPKCGSGVGLLLNKNIDGNTLYGKTLYTKDGKTVQENSTCLYDSALCTDPDPVEACALWILVNASYCPGDPNDPENPNNPCNHPSHKLDINLALQGNQLVLTYTHCGVTKTTAVSTTKCASSSSSAPPDTSSSSSSEEFSSSSSSSESSSSESSASDSSDSSDGSETTTEPSDVPIINIVDRIGVSHKVGDMVYAYYDTYSHQYIVLQSSQKTTSTSMIYGPISGSSISVLGGSDSELVGQNIGFTNPLNITTGCYGQNGIACKVYVC